MNQRNFTYAKTDSNFYEVMRIKTESNALIDPERTKLNYEIRPHHSALDPSNFLKHNRGLGIAKYHKGVTGRSARMKGDEKQLSKAVGAIISLPKDYLTKKYTLSDEEYTAIQHYVELEGKNKPKSMVFYSVMKKLSQIDLDEQDLELIREFFESALRCWMKNAGLREEFLLYAVVHLDESWPHLHIMALPAIAEQTIDKTTGETVEKIRFSTDKFNNHRTQYFDTLHSNIIELMREDGIDASGLLNGATKDGAFTPGDLSRQQRKEGVEMARLTRAMSEHKDILKGQVAETESVLAEQKRQLAQQKEELAQMANKKKELKKEIDNLQAEILTEKQNKKLAQNSGIKSLMRGNTVEITVSYDLAQSLKKSELTRDKLEIKAKKLGDKEKQLKQRFSNLDAEVECRVQERLPQEIKEYKDKEEQIRKEKEAQEKKRAELEEQARNLENQKREIENMQRNMDTIINEQVKKRLDKLIRDKIVEIFNRLSEKVHTVFRGSHQEHLLDKISSLKLPREMFVDGREYGGMSVGDALEKAERRDIREMLLAQGVPYSNIDVSDIVRVKKIIKRGKTLNEALTLVADEISNDGPRGH